MRVLLIRYQANPEIVDVDHSLQSFQRLVDGMTEVVEPFQDSSVVLVSDERVRDKGKAANRVIDEKMDICRDFFLSGQGDDQLCDFPVYREYYDNTIFYLPS